MQAINLEHVLANNYRSTGGDFTAFLFTGTMPNSVADLPYRTVSDLYRNSRVLAYAMQNDHGGPGNIEWDFSPTFNHILPYPGRSHFDGQYHFARGRMITWGTARVDPPTDEELDDPITTQYGTFLDRHFMMNRDTSWTQFGFRTHRWITLHFDEEHTFDAIAFRQSTYGYTWGGARNPGTLYARTIRIDHWDSAQGAWVNGQGREYNTNTTGPLVIPLDVPVTTRAIAVYGAGPGSHWGSHPGHTTFSNPRWRVQYVMGLVSKASQPQPTNQTHPLTWGVLIPTDATFRGRAMNETLDGLTQYADYNGEHPIIMFDVGGQNSGATMELTINPVPDELQPQVHKFNINFES
jgi:hypothetical protein